MNTQYGRIAGAIRATRDRIGDTTELCSEEQKQQLRGVRRTAAHIADAFANADPDFNVYDFLRLCGYGEPTRLAMGAAIHAKGEK
jgi:hypothetical protein